MSKTATGKAKYIEDRYIGMTALSTEPGDVFLLFHTLPYDFEEDLPLAIGPNVYIDSTPLGVLAAADPPSLADYILPGYHLPGLGLTNCCLRSPTAEVRPPGLGPTDLFFLSITALRLRAPVAIEIAGQFELGRQDELIKNPILFQLKSPWQPDRDARYSGEDVNVAAEIARRLIQVAERNPSRLTSAIVLFSQVTCGLSQSLQMSYLALFATLEALFIPQGDRAATLACRIARFLSPFEFPVPLHDWLRKEYVYGRNNLAHGVQDVVPWTRTRESKAEAFGRLHEVTRLSILSFVSLSNDKLESLFLRNKRKQLQKELDSLGPVTGRFLEGQRMWCA